MSLIVKEPENSSKFPPLDAGTYPAVCYGVVDLGDHYSDKYDKYVRKILIMWELPGEVVETEEGSVTRTITETYGASLSERSNLRKVLEAWRGKPFTVEELKGFDVTKLLGVSCYINVIQKEGKEGKIFAKVQAVMRSPKNAAPIEGTLPHVIFDLDSHNALEDMKELPEWIQKRIMESYTYETMTTQFTDIQDEKLPWEN